MTQPTRLPEITLPCKVYESPLFLRVEVARTHISDPELGELDVDFCTNVDGTPLVQIQHEGADGWITYSLPLPDIIHAVLADYKAHGGQ